MTEAQNPDRFFPCVETLITFSGPYTVDALVNSSNRDFEKVFGLVYGLERQAACVQAVNAAKSNWVHSLDDDDRAKVEASKHLPEYEQPTDCLKNPFTLRVKWSKDVHKAEATEGVDESRGPVKERHEKPELVLRQFNCRIDEMAAQAWPYNDGLRCLATAFRHCTHPRAVLQGKESAKIIKKIRGASSLMVQVDNFRVLWPNVWHAAAKFSPDLHQQTSFKKMLHSILEMFLFIKDSPKFDDVLPSLKRIVYGDGVDTGTVVKAWPAWKSKQLGVKLDTVSHHHHWRLYPVMAEGLVAKLKAGDISGDAKQQLSKLKRFDPASVSALVEQYRQPAEVPLKSPAKKKKTGEGTPAKKSSKASESCAGASLGVANLVSSQPRVNDNENPSVVLSEYDREADRVATLQASRPAEPSTREAALLARIAELEGRADTEAPPLKLPDADSEDDSKACAPSNVGAGLHGTPKAQALDCGGAKRKRSPERSQAANPDTKPDASKPSANKSAPRRRSTDGKTPRATVATVSKETADLRLCIGGVQRDVRNFQSKFDSFESKFNRLEELIVSAQRQATEERDRNRRPAIELEDSGDEPEEPEDEEDNSEEQRGDGRTDESE